MRLLSYTKGGKHLGVVDVYTKIPYDLSGSISKNRFRQELCWGISKMFDLFDKEDFCVVFDYKCDIEIHFNDSIEFYQIKTHKIQSPYKFSNLKRHKDGPSIIAKLFVLKDTSSPDVPIRCAIVSNAFLQIGKVAISDKESFSFEELDEKSQSAVKAALTEELVRENVDLSNLYYIYTPMNLFAPQNDIIGKITGSFERIKGCEPVKPNALYRLIVDTGVPNMSNSINENYISIEDAALFLNIKPVTLRKWIKDKNVPAHKIGKQWKFKRSELEEWVKSGKSAME